MERLTTDFRDYLNERLQEPGAVVGYLNAALEGGDPSTFLLALRNVAEAQGIASIASMADLNRESLYRMLSDQGNPRLSSMLAVLGAIGVQIQLRPLSQDVAKKSERDEMRPMLADTEKGYILELEEGYDSTYTREPEPVAA